jgi:hypothetical protein
MSKFDWALFSFSNDHEVWDKQGFSDLNHFQVPINSTQTTNAFAQLSTVKIIWKTTNG